VLTDVTTDMVITKEETFGPVAPLYRFKSEGEAVKMANEAPHPSLPRPRGRVREGVVSYFYSRDIGRIWRVAEASNTASSASTKASSRPKARWRDRALRRHEGKRHRPNLVIQRGSKYGIEESLEVKCLCMGGIDR
jgi:succinate-semialdehyde dehydrogenase/glutarate-semialdehyde dehydrogenase